MGRPLLFFLVLMTLWGTVTACSCLYKSPEQKYCDSHFVIRLVIKSRLVVLNKRIGYYKIRSSVWKFPTKMFDRLYTRKSSASCGVTGLEVNKRYLVSGTIKKGKLWIDSCNSILHKKRLDSAHRSLKRKPPTCKW